MHFSTEIGWEPVVVLKMPTDVLASLERHSQYVKSSTLEDKLVPSHKYDTASQLQKVLRH